MIPVLSKETSLLYRMEFYLEQEVSQCLLYEAYANKIGQQGTGNIFDLAKFIHDMQEMQGSRFMRLWTRHSTIKTYQKLKKLKRDSC